MDNSYAGGGECGQTAGLYDVNRGRTWRSALVPSSSLITGAWCYLSVRGATFGLEGADADV